jgi:DtxR family Mn-dependent transcriptional regulator
VSVEHAHATPAEEEYLQIIYWLMEAELPITGANIARAMRLSPPTVHEMLGRLENDGYVAREEDRSLRFTDTGLEQAEAIVGRHRLIERFLTDVVGIAWDDVHEEAEKLEHAMSPAFEQWMITAVGDAKTCPHGHPISPGNRIPGVPLADVEEGADVVILRFENEAEDILHYLKRAGLHTGLAGKLAESNDDDVVVASNGSSLTVTRSVAETVSVKADPSPPPRTALPEQLVLGKDRYGR